MKTAVILALILVLAAALAAGYLYLRAATPEASLAAPAAPSASAEPVMPLSPPREELETPKEGPAVPSGAAPKPARPAVPAPAIARESTRPGALFGRVVFDGPPPAIPPLQIDAGQATGCDHAGPLDLTDPRLRIDPSGGIANAVITVRVPGQSLESAGQVLELAERSCRFEPHVAMIAAGATVRFKNADPIPHELRAESRKHPALSQAIAPGGTLEQVYSEADVVAVRCELHPWASGWIAVTDTPFTALTQADGSFQIHGLPPGEHALEVWHETLGRSRHMGRVSADTTSRLEIRLGGPRAR
ncbi:MAG TPA: carboxypeptidase regulatory-like domain-containing protein [Planctomycetota bacterium]|nr:carboxypeptidase regulatory-like domain-containing protein [Planctomycetota bacterium]